VIDMQKGIVALPTVHPAPEITDRVARLARAFRENGLPSCWSTSPAGPQAALKRHSTSSPPADGRSWCPSWISS